MRSVVLCAVLALAGCAAGSVGSAGASSDTGSSTGGSTGGSSGTSTAGDSGSSAAGSTASGSAGSSTSSGSSGSGSSSGGWVFAPTTTLAEQTANNGSGYDGFPSWSDGNAAPTRISTVDIHRLLYPGATTKIYVDYQPWFCTNAAGEVSATDVCNGHVQIGLDENDAAVIHRQMNDMIARHIDGVAPDWYGPGKFEEGPTALIRDDLAPRCSAPQQCPLMLVVMEDGGSFKWACGNGGWQGLGYGSVTACVTALLNRDFDYLNANYFGSDAYLKVGGRPVVVYFLDQNDALFSGVDWTQVWPAVRSHTTDMSPDNGDPLFVYLNRGGFSHVDSAGAYAWVANDCGLDPSCAETDWGQNYLDDFYAAAVQQPSLQSWGGAWKGFDDTVASWSPPGGRIINQRCGQTWVQSFAKAGEYYSSSNQMPFEMVATWNDYEEGTEIETGIDNCYSVAASVSGDVLSWQLESGDADATPETVDHFTVFLSNDGANLQVLADDVPVYTSELDLSQYALPAGDWQLFVEMVGVSSVQNRMSPGVSYSR